MIISWPIRLDIKRIQDRAVGIVIHSYHKEVSVFRFVWSNEVCLTAADALMKL
jgi:hypothetical protein